MAAVSLFWYTNMAAVTSCENALLEMDCVKEKKEKKEEKHDALFRHCAEFYVRALGGNC